MKTSWIVLLAILPLLGIAQKNKTQRPYACGYYAKDFEAMKHSYESTKFYDVQKGEKVASVGAANGSREVIIAAFVDSVDWTIQDIDTTCLNQVEFQKVMNHTERINGKPIIGKFRIVIGTERQTNLDRNSYDRIILANVYHELTDLESMMKDISRALNDSGVVLIQDRMNSKPNKIRKDCGHIGLYEPDFLKEMKGFGYELIGKKTEPNFEQVAFYTFTKKPLK
jgi:SAM-dependent methyltransferase